MFRAVSDLTDGEPYRLLTALVVPRPIAWVSTVSADGVANLAPHSFFTVASTSPPIVQVTSVGCKDTLRNAQATGQLVVNLAPRRLLAAMNATATTDPVDEFERAGVTAVPATLVAVPRVAQSPAALECVVHDVVPCGDSHLLLARVVAVHVDDDALLDGAPAEWLLDPVARASGSRYVTYGETIELPRPD